MDHVFIGFYGWDEPEMNQGENIVVFGDGFERWNLRKFSAEEFITEIQKKIPPVNENVLRNYLTEDDSSDGVTKERYGKYLWGLLLPIPEDDYLIGYNKALSVLDLFSPAFMSPAFYVTNMGITRIKETRQVDAPPNDHQGYDLFNTQEFVDFYNHLYEQTNYFIWMRDRAVTWNNEDWRLFMAAHFYGGLKEYSRGKSLYTWQRESADMATFLETLFTAGDTQNEEIGYRLRKRVACLIQWKFPETEKEIKTLYKDRSEFVHGAYYKRILREMRGNPHDNAMPQPPDFGKLYATKEFLRVVFVAYLYLAKEKQNHAELAEFSSIQEILERCVIDTELRTKVIDVVAPVVNLLSTNIQ